MGTMSKPALFLDRDGVICQDKGYLYQAKDVVFYQAILKLIQHFKNKDFLVICLTNQSGIGRGLFTEKNFLDLCHYMDQEMNKESALIDAWFFCPHLDQGCDCRKPQIGLVKQAQKKFSINLEHSLMIGDKNSDVLPLDDITYYLIRGQYPIRSDDKIKKIFTSHDECLSYFVKKDLTFGA
jgi:D-glycero-D-manno-heptose 1,7-bisphosphate phosphatase